ncbi:putative Polycomb group protein ASXL2 [Anneissia japonica]|uniref:putative Polycomb group protein ASXL2 n=1 Tax=Anneissia japonica TaxID=1529436 RepID=UPI0014255E7E|nr:putative Polycomb group protein ASXL2 [Anneissia japonica]
MTFKEILIDIQKNNYKDIRGTEPFACLNAMLHLGCRGKESPFYKVSGLHGIYGLRKMLPSGVDDLLETLNEETEPTYDGTDDPIRPLPIKKRPVYILPVSAHSYIPSLGRFKNQQPGSPTAKAAVKRSGKEHSHRPWKSSIRRPHRRPPNIIPRIILKPLKPPPGYQDKDSAVGASEVRTSQRLSKRKDLDGVVKSFPDGTLTSSPPRWQTVQEILASVPGYSGKSRKKMNKRAGGCIDLETPDSILANTNLRALINKHTFASLPPHYQHKLISLLPEPDRYRGSDNVLRISSSAMSNEFFARACTSWRESLSEGEFTPEAQLKIKQELEKEKVKLDPWKLKHFEPVWGQSTIPKNPDTNYSVEPATTTTTKVSPVKVIEKQTTVPSSGKPAMAALASLRSPVVTRSVTATYRPTNASQIKIETSNKYTENMIHKVKSDIKTVPSVNVPIVMSNTETTKVEADLEVANIIPEPGTPSSSPSPSPSPANTSQFTCSSLLSSMAAESQRNKHSAGETSTTASCKSVSKLAEMLKKPSQVVSSDKSNKRPATENQGAPEKRIRKNESEVKHQPRIILKFTKGKSSPHVRMQTELKPVKTTVQVKHQLPRVKGQTKTLAQIKAQNQTKAKFQARRPGTNKMKTPYYMNSFVPTNATAVVSQTHSQGSTHSVPQTSITLTAPLQSVSQFIVRPVSVVLMGKPQMQLISTQAQSLSENVNPSGTMPSSIMTPGKQVIILQTTTPSVTVPNTQSVVTSSTPLSPNGRVHVVESEKSVENKEPNTAPNTQLINTPIKPSQDRTINGTALSLCVTQPSQNVVLENHNPNSLLPAGLVSGNKGTVSPFKADNLNATTKCTCRVKAMILCQGCGAFCHDDCIGPTKLCVTCLIR